MGDWTFDVHRAACFRESMMYGLVAGVCMGAVKGVRTREFIRAGNTLFVTFCAVATVSWSRADGRC